MKSSIYSSVTDAVAAAKGAYSRYSKLTLNERQEILEGVKKALRPIANELAAMTVSETGMGNVCDKAQKIKLAIEKTPGVEDLITEVNTGDHGMTLYELSPFGIVCAVQPCTNPCATLISNTIGMLAAGNAIIHCPHPRAVKVSGKKVIGAGPANPVAIVDATANFEKAARDIVRGASFDNNLMCTSEKCMVVEEKAADRFIFELLKNGVYYVKNEEEIQKLLDAAVTGDFVINKKLEGRSANEILEYAGIPCNGTIKLIVAETERIHPFVTLELLMPLVPLVKAADFEEALEIALDVEQGYKHTATIHSESIEHLNQAAKEMQTSVFVKNGPSFMGIGFDKEGHTSFTIATTTGEGTTTARHFARRRRCTLTSGFSIR